MIHKIKQNKRVTEAIQGLSRYDVSINGVDSDFKALLNHLEDSAADGSRTLCLDVKNDNPEFDRGYIKGILMIAEFLDVNSKRTHEL